MKKVEVTWIDSTFVNHGSWTNKSEVDVPIMECKTIGYLVVNNKERITICSSFNDNEYGGILIIPKVAVTKINYLTNKKEE